MVQSSLYGATFHTWSTVVTVRMEQYQIVKVTALFAVSALLSLRITVKFRFYTF
jgi:hypothetical protein